MRSDDTSSFDVIWPERDLPTRQMHVQGALDVLGKLPAHYHQYHLPAPTPVFDHPDDDGAEFEPLYRRAGASPSECSSDPVNSPTTLHLTMFEDPPRMSLYDNDGDDIDDIDDHHHHTPDVVVVKQKKKKRGSTGRRSSSRRSSKGGGEDVNEDHDDVDAVVAPAARRRGSGKNKSSSSSNSSSRSSSRRSSRLYHDDDDDLLYDASERQHDEDPIVSDHDA